MVVYTTVVLDAAVTRGLWFLLDAVPTATRGVIYEIDGLMAGGLVEYNLQISQRGERRGR
jgi:hypothetical protein